MRAKVEGRDTGLPKEIADLFPDRLVDSELGEIPQGWEIGNLSDHFEAVKGVSYKGSGLGRGGMPLHNLNSIHEGGGYKYEGIKFYSGEYADRHLVRPGDVIVANTEQGHDRLLIGYAAIVPELFGDRGIASHHVYRLPGSKQWTTIRAIPASAPEFPMDARLGEWLRQRHDSQHAPGRRGPETNGPGAREGADRGLRHARVAPGAPGAK